MTRTQAGDLYVIDGFKIRKQNAQGLVSTFGKLESSTHYSANLTTDANGNLYVVEANQLRKIDTGGVTVWRKGTVSFPPDEVMGTLEIVANDPAGNVYLFHRIYQSGQTRSLIRKVSAEGELSTVVDLSDLSFAPYTTAPALAMDVDSAGNIYLASASQIWRVTVTGQVSLIAGHAQQGTADGKGTEARFCWLRPNSLTLDRLNNIYVADTQSCNTPSAGNGTAIRKISPDGTVTTLVSTTNLPIIQPDGPAASAYLREISGLFMDQQDNLLIADHGLYAIRQLDKLGQVTTIAGPTPAYGHLDGQAQLAHFRSPSNLVRASNGDVYVGDGNVIRKIAANGTVTTLAGSPGSNAVRDGNGPQASFVSISAMALAPSGTLVVADNRLIRTVSPEGVVTTLAGNNAAPICSSLGQDGLGSSAAFGSFIASLTVDKAGVIYASEFLVDCGIIGIRAVGNVIRKITPDGNVSTFVGKPGGFDPAITLGQGSGVAFGFLLHLAVDSAGNLYAEDSRQILKITPAGVVSRFASLSEESSAFGVGGMAMDANDNLYVSVASQTISRSGIATTHPAALKRIAPDGTITTIVTAKGESGGAVIAGSTPDFDRTRGLAISPSGLVYLSMEYAVYTYGVPSLTK
ncbi:hypothetical protein [Chitinimonas sp. BJYL2]|uniref:hypothetical protein n=1 Tax=Chitinimonas sp. BJYL2 TaxID=2976696 RepID=UPI0022B52F09|nr:hypothetical protein [Chitinimonas sp. BJYL2]